MTKQPPKPLTAGQLIVIIICTLSVLGIGGGVTYAAIHKHAQDVQKRNERELLIKVYGCEITNHKHGTNYDCGD